jgi:hypothetical protein
MFKGQTILSGHRKKKKANDPLQQKGQHEEHRFSREVYIPIRVMHRRETKRIKLSGHGISRMDASQKQHNRNWSGL